VTTPKAEILVILPEAGVWVITTVDGARLFSASVSFTTTLMIAGTFSSVVLESSLAVGAVLVMVTDTVATSHKAGVLSSHVVYSKVSTPI